MIDYMATTATLENVNKFSKIGLRMRPTYQEILGLIDENEKLGQPLPNRDATFSEIPTKVLFLMGLSKWKP